jgi:hypothetical protein
MGMMNPEPGKDRNISLAVSFFPCHGEKFKMLPGNQRFLRQFFKKLAGVSIEKEWQWVSRQFQQVLKRQGPDV